MAVIIPVDVVQAPPAPRGWTAAVIDFVRERRLGAAAAAVILLMLMVAACSWAR